MPAQCTEQMSCNSSRSGTSKTLYLQQFLNNSVYEPYIAFQRNHSLVADQCGHTVHKRRILLDQGSQHVSRVPDLVHLSLPGVISVSKNNKDLGKRSAV